jgi:acyl carrier protein
LEAHVSSIQRQVRSFITSELSGDLSSIRDDESLLEAGIIDSLAMLQLVAFLEKQFDLRILEDDMMPDNFESLDAIAAYVTRSKNGYRP